MSDNPEEVAANWRSATDPKTGKTYYYNKVTKKTVWNKPACLGDADPPASKSSASAVKKEEPKEPAKSESGSDEQDPNEVAANWRETTDPKTGKTYYYNKVTKKTSWKKPACLETADKGKEAEKEKEKEKEKEEEEKAKKKTSSESDDEDEKPAEKAKPAPAPAVPAAPAAAADSEDPNEVAANWRETTDPKSGKTYYYNKVTKKTSWKKPPCLEAAEKEKESPKKEEAKKKKKTSDSEDEEDSEDEKPSKKSDKEKDDKKKAKKSSDDDESEDEGSDDEKAKPPAKKEDEKKADLGKRLQSSDDEDEKPKKPAKKSTSGDDDEESDDEGDKKKSIMKKLRSSDSESDDDDKKKKDDSKEDAAMRLKKEMHAKEVSEARKKLQDDDDESAAEQFKFAKHRHGWFNRLFRVGDGFDEARLLSFKKSLIKKALLKQNRDLDEEAIQCFKNIMSYMGDRKSSKGPMEHAKKLLRNLMLAPSGLRDEAYMQLCKQTTLNPRMESTIKGWELMIYFLATFPPSKALKNFLTDYIEKNAKDESRPKVAELAKLCLQRLPTIILMGQRKQVPSALELECLRELKPVPLRVNLVNGSFKTINVDPYTLVQDVQDQLAQKLGLQCTSPFALYEAADVNEPSRHETSIGVERILDPKDRILDVYASWENGPLLAEEKSDDPVKKAKQPEVKVSTEAKEQLERSKNVRYNSFLYKARLVLKTTNKEIMADPEAINLIYLQAVSDVVTSRYPCNEKDVTVLAALQLQATHGDFKKDVHVPGWLAPKLHEYMPKDLLLKKGKASTKLEKEWEQMILAKYQKVSGFTALEAKLNYLDYVQEWTFYGSTFFIVEQRQFKDYPSPLILGINCEGVILMHPEKKTVLENYLYTDIVTWGHSDEKFIIVVGNIIQQRKLIFKTTEGKAMNHLIHDYVKFKVKNKQ